MAAHCPLCDGDCADAFTTRDRNRGVSEEPFLYRRCLRCGALHLGNPPADLAPFYPSAYFELPAIGELRERAAAERYRMDLVAPHVALGGRLIEIGPGDGIFAVQALDAGFDVTAIEADPAAAAHLRDVLGIEVVESAAPEERLAALGPARASVA